MILFYLKYLILCKVCLFYFLILKGMFIFKNWEYLFCVCVIWIRTNTYSASSERKMKYICRVVHVASYGNKIFSIFKNPTCFLELKNINKIFQVKNVKSFKIKTNKIKANNKFFSAFYTVIIFFFKKRDIFSVILCLGYFFRNLLYNIYNVCEKDLTSFSV